MEDHWNNRYPKINQNYSKYENKLTYSIDVRDFFTPYDSNIPTVSGATNDEKALNGLKYVINNVTYVPDKTNFGYDEYWAWAFETLTRKKGDCEDGAILLANILVNSGVPYWRVRLNAGSVNGGGHCYLTYCRETDNQFVVLDWCYWPNSKPVAERLLHSQEQNYDDPSKNFGIWFSWNQKYCFGAMQTMQGMPKYFGK
jgi:predicted transglutaminase-like cysteine proteinase